MEGTVKEGVGGGTAMKKPSKKFGNLQPNAE